MIPGRPPAMWDSKLVDETDDTTKKDGGGAVLGTSDGYAESIESSCQLREVV